MRTWSRAIRWALWGLLCGPVTLAQTQIRAFQPQNDPSQARPGGATPYPVINDWGDSISQGGEDGTPTTICSALHSMSGIPCINYGIAGQKSSGIAARMGAVPVHVAVEGGVIPEVGDVAIEFSPSDYSPMMPGRPRLMVKGSIVADDGTQIPGNTHCPTTACYFTRLQPGARKNATGARSWISGYSREGFNIIEACTNNIDRPEDCLKDVAAMVASIPTGSSYVVLPPFVGDTPEQWRGGRTYANAESIAKEEARLYPNNFIDVRRALVMAHPPGKDLVLNHDITPANLRSVLESGVLTAPLGASGCQMMTNGMKCVRNDSYVIDSESIYVTSCIDGQVGSCTRGWDNTRAAAHAAGASVQRLDWLHPNGAGLTLIAEKIWQYLQGQQAQPLNRRPVPSSNGINPGARTERSE